MKKQILLLASLTVLASFQAYSKNRSTFEITNFNGDFIEQAQQINIKYQSDGGGYSYLMYNREESSDIFVDFEGQAVEFGLGVSEPWESELVDADVFLGVGYFSTQYELTDIVSSTVLDESYGGFSYHIGVEMHPFTEKLGVSFVIRHNGAASEPLNDFNGVINSKRTRATFGVSYDFDYFKVSVSKSNDDLYIASLSFPF